MAKYLGGLVVTMHQGAQEHCPKVPPLPQNILGMTHLVESSGFENDLLDAEDQEEQSEYSRDKESETRTEETD